MAKDTANSVGISECIVAYLYALGLTLKEIGEKMGLSESFISRVRKGERSLTLNHLTKLEKSLGKPLPVILVEATPVESAPKEFRVLYKAFHGVMESLE